MSKKTVIIGASTNPSRYSFQAASRLSSHQHPIVPLGIKAGEVAGQPILDLKSKPHIKDVDTVTIYINPQLQEEWSTYILSLRPKRIIFNPGTENPILEEKAKNEGINTLRACTLVMLSTQQY